MAEEDDPFGFLTKICEMTSSQELKLQKCPYYYGHPEASAAMCSDDTPSENPTQTQVTGIFMVSAPDSDSGHAIDENTPHEKEIFQTPPEHHNRRSSSSSQEFLSQREKPVGAVMEETTCLDDDVQTLLGLSETLDLREGDWFVAGRCLENVNVNDVAGILGSGTELKRFRVSKDELGKLSSKKIRVSEVIDLECEEIHAGILDKGKVRVDADSSAEANVGSSVGTVLDAQAKARCVKGSQKSGSDDVLKDNIISKEKGATRIKVDSQARNLEKDKYVDLLEKVIPTLNSEGRRVEDTKKNVSKQRRVLPLSLRGKEKDTQGGGEEKGRNVKGGKLSWEEMIDAVEIIFKVDESSEDVDFIETAKKKGYNFPQPRYL